MVGREEMGEEVRTMEEDLIHRVGILESENRALREVLVSMAETLRELGATMERHLTDFEKLEGRLQYVTLQEAVTRLRVDNLPYELSDPSYQLPVPIPHIRSIEETRRLLVEEGCSIARFGDGEFAAIAGRQRWRFQRADDRLAERLIEVLRSEEEGLLIGLISYYGSLSDRSVRVADGVRHYLTEQVRREHAALLDPTRIYANSGIHRYRTEEDVKALRALWEDRDCLFIEGEQTRMGVGNDLFDNCRSIRRILCPAESAFDRYEEILEAALAQPRDRLVLIALGPTASVLAYDLFHQGFQAIDLGHADLLYDKYRQGDADMRIRYKYDSVNEVREERIDSIDDPAYEEQVICRIV